jgi:hypothetical protein
VKTELTAYPRINRNTIDRSLNSHVPHRGVAEQIVILAGLIKFSKQPEDHLVTPHRTVADIIIRRQLTRFCVHSKPVSRTGHATNPSSTPQYLLQHLSDMLPSSFLSPACSPSSLQFVFVFRGIKLQAGVDIPILGKTSHAEPCH